MSTLAHLEKLIAFPTVSAASNLDCINYIDTILKPLGFETFRIPDQTGQKAGLFARIGPTDRKGIMLSGHTDVVPVEGQNWSVDPFKLTLRNGKAYGRGTTDMKGYLACMLTAAEQAAKLDLKQPLKLAFSYDEEIGCVGIRDMIGQLDKTIGTPDMCFVGEPTNMQIAIGHKGKAALRATVHGQTGHSALAPKFSNAINAAAEFITRLRALQNDIATNGPQDPAYDIPYTTLHVGKIQGGRALNIVPDLCEVDFEYRHLAQDDPQDILHKIKAIANENTVSGCEIEVKVTNSYHGLETNEDSEIVNLAKKISPNPKPIKVPYGTEAGYFTNTLSIPTIVCGPGSMEGQGHKADEYIHQSELSLCENFLESVLRTL